MLALVVDEAQSVPYELLEEIRLLTNVEAASGRSLALALVGQPELAGRLDEPRLRQLKQRVVLRCELTPLSLKETAAYISGRIKTAGGDATRLFSRDAVVAIHAAVDGHSPHHQRDLRQRARQRFCRRPETGRGGDHRRGLQDAVVATRPTELAPCRRAARAIGSPSRTRREAPMFAGVRPRRRFSFF